MRSQPLHVVTTAVAMTLFAAPILLGTLERYVLGFDGSTASIILGAIAVGFCAATLWNHHTPLRSPWGLLTFTFALTVTTSATLTALGVRVDQGMAHVASTNAPLYLGIAAAHVWLIRRWSGRRTISILLNSITLSAATLTVLTSAAWIVLNQPYLYYREAWDAIGIFAVTLPLVLTMSRLWFEPGNSTAVRLIAAVPIGIFSMDIAKMVSVLDNIQPQPIFYYGWLFAMATALLACNHPSVTARPSDATRELGTDYFEAGTVAACLLTPAGALFVIGTAGVIIPWQLIAAGSTIVVCAGATRIILLYRTTVHQQRTLTALVNTDPLTGLGNRRAWNQAIDHAEAQPADIWVYMIDIDHFKRFNDRHGHVAGDTLLQEAAHAWRAVLRSSDTLCRYGGEEFALLLTTDDVEAALAVARRLQESMPRDQTCSVGMARWAPHQSAKDVIIAADRALYAAKRKGRKRIEVAGDARGDVATVCLTERRDVTTHVPGEAAAAEHQG